MKLENLKNNKTCIDAIREVLIYNENKEPNFDNSAYSLGWIIGIINTHDGKKATDNIQKE